MNLALNRKQVFAASLIESVVFTGFVLGCALRWYPDIYFSLFEVWSKIAFLGGGFLLLGPVLNLLVYKDDRKKYANDLTAICLIRILALLIGLHFLYSHRPILLVFSVDRFVIVQNHHVSLTVVPPAVAEMIWLSKEPPIVAARKFSEKDLSQLLQIMSGAPDIEYRPERYELFKYQYEYFIDRMCPHASAKILEPEKIQWSCDVVDIPLVYGGEKYATVIFDVETFKVREVTTESPW